MLQTPFCMTNSPLLKKKEKEKKKKGLNESSPTLGNVGLHILKHPIPIISVFKHSLPLMHIVHTKQSVINLQTTIILQISKLLNIKQQLCLNNDLLQHNKFFMSTTKLTCMKERQMTLKTI